MQRQGSLLLPRSNTSRLAGKLGALRSLLTLTFSMQQLKSRAFCGQHSVRYIFVETHTFVRAICSWRQSIQRLVCQIALPDIQVQFRSVVADQNYWVVVLCLESCSLRA